MQKLSEHKIWSGVLLTALFVVLVAIDQLTKAYAYAGNFGDFLNSLRPIFGKQIFPNYNFAFSLQINHVLIYVLYAILMVLLVWWYTNSKEKSVAASIGFVLILAGALSNIVDRVMLGYVRDFIFVFWGNVFDIADMYIIAGILLMIF
jgi:signal peptidase II